MTAKNIVVLLAILCFASCDQSDGNDRTPVEYRLLAGANTVSSISFTGANGQPASVSASNLSDNWTQKIWVVKPFTAALTVELSNQTDEDQEYVLQVYRKNGPIGTVVDTVPAMSVETGTVSASVAN